jgi:hypothetical protein
MVKLNIYDTIDEVLASLADYFIVAANECIAQKGEFTCGTFRRHITEKVLQLVGYKSLQRES